MIHDIGSAMRDGFPQPDAPISDAELAFDLESIVRRKASEEIWALIPRIAALPEAEVALVKQRIRAAFPAIPARDFDRAVRDHRRRAREPSDAWRESLIASEGGSSKPILANAITALRDAPEWAGVLAYDAFAMRSVAVRAAPCGVPAGEAWSDHAERLTADWLQHQGILVAPEIAGQAADVVARAATYHPVRRYLEGVVWDGVPRIDGWLATYLGADVPDASEGVHYAEAIGSRWLISAVARIMKPGCKADCVLILEGPQGKKKSTALATMGGKWFTDEVAELGSKDSSMATIGAWIIEMAELSSIARAEQERVKAFVSRSVDRFRPPYGRHVIESPRQCVFAGSTNQGAYQSDETGGRRWWPIACGSIDIEALTRDRDQLWAEAVERYRAGACWWIDSAELTAEAELEQEKRYVRDTWQDPISDWLARPRPDSQAPAHYPPFTSDTESVTSTDVLLHCIRKRLDQLTQADKNRVSRCLVRLKWQRRQARGGSARQWRYFAPEKT